MARRLVLASFLLLCVFFPGARIPGQTGVKGQGHQENRSPKDDRDADRKAIKLATESFIKAFQSGDAKGGGGALDHRGRADGRRRHDLAKPGIH